MKNKFLIPMLFLCIWNCGREVNSNTKGEILYGREKIKSKIKTIDDLCQQIDSFDDSEICSGLLDCFYALPLDKKIEFRPQIAHKIQFEGNKCIWLKKNGSKVVLFNNFFQQIDSLQETVIFDDLINLFLFLPSEFQNELKPQIKLRLKVKDGKLFWKKQDNTDVVLYDTSNEDKGVFIKKIIEYYNAGIFVDLGWATNELKIDIQNIGYFQGGGNSWVDDWFGDLQEGDAKILEIPFVLEKIGNDWRNNSCKNKCIIGIGGRWVEVNISAYPIPTHRHFNEFLIDLSTLAKVGILSPRKYGFRLTEVPDGRKNFSFTCVFGRKLGNFNLNGGHENNLKYLIPSLHFKTLTPKINGYDTIIEDDNSKSFKGSLQLNEYDGVSAILPLFGQHKRPFFECAIRDGYVTINGSNISLLFNNLLHSALLRQIIYLYSCGALVFSENSEHLEIAHNNSWVLFDIYFGEYKSICNFDEVKILVGSGKLKWKDGNMISKETKVESEKINEKTYIYRIGDWEEKIQF